MADITLQAKKRSIFGKKVGRGRKSGSLPAILYGHDIQNVPLTLSSEDFVKVLAKAGQNTMVKLEIENDGNKEARTVLIHDVSRDPVSGKPVHADFYQIRTDEKIRVSVPLVFVGESPAVKFDAGILVKVAQEVEVEAFPQHLPHEIEVDISNLKTFEDKIYTRNLKIPANVEVIAVADSVVALIQPPRSEEELKALEEKPVEAVEAVKVEAEEKKDVEAEAEVAGEAEAAAPEK